MSLPVFIPHHHGELILSRAITGQGWKLPLDGTYPLRAGYIHVLAHPTFSSCFPPLSLTFPFHFLFLLFFSSLFTVVNSICPRSPTLGVYHRRSHSCCGHRLCCGNTRFVHLGCGLTAFSPPSLHYLSFCHSWSRCYRSSLFALERSCCDFHTSSSFFHPIVILPSSLAAVRLLSCQHCCCYLLHSSVLPHISSWSTIPSYHPGPPMSTFSPLMHARHGCLGPYLAMDT
jgi:hypothetical protein